jgi:hypothetical protein
MLPDEEGHDYGTGTYAHRWNVDWRRISWGAIFAGTLVTLAIFLTLQILGAGIDATAIDLTGAETFNPRAHGIGAAILGSLVVPAFHDSNPRGRDRAREIKVERETYAAH